MRERVAAGEKDPFRSPDTLLRGFNQLILTCALRDVPRAERPISIPEFVTTWASLPLAEWGVKVDIPADTFAVGDSASAPGNGLRLLAPDYNGRPTALCRKLSRGEIIPLTVNGASIVNKVVNLKAIAKGK